MTVLENDSLADRAPSSQSPPAPVWHRIWTSLTGTPEDGPAPKPPGLTIWSLALIAGLLITWRAAISVFSVAWARLGVVDPWPEAIDQYAFLRYSVRWDSGWYLTIARDGYEHAVGDQSSIAFFPLFPAAIRFFDAILPGSDILAGLIVVHVALFAAMIYIYKLVQLDYPEIVAWRTLFFTLLFPGAFFFSALYTESLLLLGFAGTLYHARRGQWALAAGFGIFTGLTKLIGIVLVAPVVLEMIRQRAVSRDNLQPAFFATLTPAGAVAYLAWIQIQYGDFREYFEAQSHWFRQTFSPQPFTMFAEVLLNRSLDEHPYPANVTAIHDVYVLVDMGALFLFVAAGVYLWLRVRPSYGALVLAGTLVPALSGTPLAMMRYMAILFPVFIVLARVKSEAIRTGATMLFGVGLVFVTFLFVNGFWAG